MELTAVDDLPFHQHVTPMHVPWTSDPHFQDGYYFAAYRDGLHVFLGLRLHPNTNTTDGYAGVVRDGWQRNVRVSRALLPAHDDLGVGPLRLDIVEPMVRQRLTLAENPTGLRFDLTFTASCPPFVERPEPQYRFGRLYNHVVRYTLPCRVDGWIEVDGEREDVTRWYGCRDHSWGIRSTMGPYVPIGGVGSGFSDPDHRAMRLWVPFELEDDVAGFLHTHEDADGRTLDLEGRLHLADGSSRRVVGLEHELRYDPAGPRLTGARLQVHDDTGAVHDLDVEVACDPAHPQGFGYTRGWFDGGQPGVYRGGRTGSYEEHDRFRVDDPAGPVGPEHIAVERRLGGTEFASRIRRRDGSAVGMAHVEHMRYGGH